MGWEDFGQKIADAGKDVSDKVKKVADLVCLKQKLASEERKLQTAYMEIGKLYYEKHEGEIDEEYIPLFEDVAAAAAAAADYKEQISKARNAAIRAIAEEIMSLAYCTGEDGKDGTSKEK